MTEPTTNPPIVHEGEEAAYDENGVDLTLIDWMLSLSPEERLQYLQDQIDAIIELREAVEKKNELQKYHRAS